MQHIFLNDWSSMLEKLDEPKLNDTDLKLASFDEPQLESYVRELEAKLADSFLED